MTDSECFDITAAPTIKRKSAPVNFDKGQPRTIPCRQCVDNQLKSFEQGGWRSSCCEQTTKKGLGKVCYQCRKMKKTCISFDEDNPAIDKWAAVQREPEKYDYEAALDAACDMKLHLLKSVQPMTAIQESLFDSLKSAKDTAETMIAAAEGFASSVLKFVDANDKKCDSMDPGQLPQESGGTLSRPAAEDDAEKKEYLEFAHLERKKRQPLIDEVEKKEYPQFAHLDRVNRKYEIDKVERKRYPHLKDMDADHRKQLIQLSKCRDLENALSLAQKIITTASSEVRNCLEDVRSKA